MFTAFLLLYQETLGISCVFFPLDGQIFLTVLSFRSDIEIRKGENDWLNVATFNC